MRLRHAFRLAAVAAVAGLALSGCTSSDNGDVTSSGAPVVVDQTLRIAANTAPASFQIGNWTSGGESILSTSIYDTVVTRGNDGKLLPGVAESWEYSADRMTLTFHIRPGMTFSDGTPVDAAAVVANMEVLRTAPATSQVWSSVSAVTATDDLTVVVAFSAPDAALLPQLGSVNGAIGSPKVLTADSSQLEPVGSGPYILNLDESVAGSSYVLDRNPDHWNVAAYPFAHVIVTVMPDTTAQQNALLAGQLDVIPVVASPDVVAQFPTDKFNSGKNLPSSVAALWFIDQTGSIVPALADVRVRKAINMAFDRTLIAKNLVGGDSSVTNQLFNPVSSKAFESSLLDKTPFDIAGAKKLMAEAGYPDGFEVTMPSTTITQQYEATIAQSLADIGIKVTWESLAFNDFFAKIFGGTYGMYFMYNGFSGSDATDFKATRSGIFNPFGYTTPELDALVEKANLASDADQTAAYQAINEYLVDQAWAAPLNADGGFWIASKNITYTPPVSYGLNLLPFAPAAN